MDTRERRAFEDLGRRVREARLMRGWTQETAAERLAIDLKDFQRIEAGKVNVTLRTLVRLARSLRVPLRSLFDPPASRAPRKVGRPRVVR